MTTKKIIKLIPDETYVEAFVEWYDDILSDEMTFAEHIKGAESIIEKASYLDSKAHLYRIEPEIRFEEGKSKAVIVLVYKKIGS